MPNEVNDQKTRERDSERGSFPLVCTGSRLERDTIVSICTMTGYPTGYIVRKCINAALAEVIKAESPEVYADVEALINRVIAVQPTTRFNGGVRERAK